MKQVRYTLMSLEDEDSPFSVLDYIGVCKIIGSIIVLVVPPSTVKGHLRFRPLCHTTVGFRHKR